MALQMNMWMLFPLALCVYRAAELVHQNTSQMGIFATFVQIMLTQLLTAG